VDEAVEQARNVATQRKLEIRFEPGVDVPVRGERFLLSQAIGNLLQNAIEFSPSGGVVSVELQYEAAAILVSVVDRGPGIPAFAMEKVFERFYSLPRPDTGRKSSGLGLSIVREIARLHGGEITLSNHAGGGALACFRLPRETSG
jgi:two-component system sensor histidine kinase CreC